MMSVVKRFRRSVYSMTKSDGTLSTGNKSDTMEIPTIARSDSDIFEVALIGNIQEFEKLYFLDNSCIQLQDKNGQTVGHYAASKSRLTILDFIMDHDGDLNIQDSKGNTPLHVAVEHAQFDAIRYLITHRVDTAIMNKTHLTPVHLAVELDNHDVLKFLLKFDEVCPNTRGDNGYGPLHLAAYKNCEKCTRILLDNSALLCTKSDGGYYPVHVAAKHASSNVLKLLIDEAEKYGYSRTGLLSDLNHENSTPLHSAVNSGDVLAVRICIEAGADIDVKQDDKSTPVHLACSQGAFKAIKTMFELQPLKVKDVVAAKDVNGKTPLHMAAMFDHREIIGYLLDQGADIDAVDNEERSALYVAATKRCVSTICLLVKRGANIKLKDKDGRNFMHATIKSGCRLSHLAEQVVSLKVCVDIHKVSRQLMNVRDARGCTPLHYASKEGHFGSVEELIANGAYPNMKDNEKQSPLHFAAKHGRVNSCRRLLDSSMGPNIINEMDRDGLTALHAAAKNGHSNIVSLLMQRGALLHRDVNGNSPLHLASAGGFTKTMALLVSVHPHLVNLQNKTGDTALHVASSEGNPGAVTLLMSMDALFTKNNDGQHFFDVAIRGKQRDVCVAIITHDRWREAMRLTSATGNPLYGLIQYLPDVCLAVLDRCRTHPPLNTKHRDFYYHYDFQYLQCPSSCASYFRKNAENTEFKPLHALNHMVKYNRVDCLSHPVSVQYLAMKWRAYGVWCHGANLLLYACFLTFLTYSVLTSRPLKTIHLHSHNNSSEAVNATTCNLLEDYFTWNWTLIILAVFCVANVIKEIIQMANQRLRYLLDATNYLEWTLYTTTALYAVPGLLCITTHYQWESGAVAVFLAWFNLLLFMARWEAFGIYVVMFLEILSTLFRVLVVFSVLVIAFSLAFYTLMADERHGSFGTPGLSIFSTFVMMLGELDFVETFVLPHVDGRSSTLHFDNMTFLFLALFIILMPILLMNLLIGLAVGDIESVQRNATLKRLAKQVELHTELELKLPIRLLKWVDKTETKIMPNHNRMIKAMHLPKIISSGGDHEDSEPDDSNQYLYEEMVKQKTRMKELTAKLDKQYELLRLIIQKMEIKSENDEQDDGPSYVGRDTYTQQGSGKGWSSPAVRGALLKQAAVARWKKFGLDE